MFAIMRIVSDVARLLQTSKSSVRTWSTEFSEYLSPTASPQFGEIRDYQDTDVAVLYLVKQLRDQQVPYADIHESLRQGAAKDVVVPERAIPDVRSKISSNEVQWPNGEGLERILLHVQTLTVLLSGERDYLRNQLEKERHARIEAEKRAAVAEARAKFLEESPKK